MASQDSSEQARRMLARADKILSLIDDAFIVKERHHVFRPMPRFRPEEISLGPTLGTGGFGIVNEIKSFYLDADDENTRPPEASTPHENGAGNASEHVSDYNPQDTATTEGTTSTDTNEYVEENTNNISSPDTAHKTALTPSRKNTFDQPPSEHDQEDGHYDVTQARQLMRDRCQRRHGPQHARYALKRLHGQLTTLERARGMIDLAVEAKYLSVVWHPNIIKMRGMAKGPMVDPDFFIIIDRLYETLDQRMRRWHCDERKYSGHVFGMIGKKQPLLRQLLIDRLTVAYDLAAALMYLHENRIVYRDIKPENIGFDARGDAKVFDFGLCKSLHASLKATQEGQYGYHLTGRAGSLPYMAPEVVKMETYDTKCDVFSFAILLWEMLHLTPAFKGYSPTEFVEKVVVNDERLVIYKSWPPLTRLMLPEAWDRDPRKRPDMKRVAILIRADLNDMTTDERVLQRTQHMVQRSDHSFADSEKAFLSMP